MDRLTTMFTSSRLTARSRAPSPQSTTCQRVTPFPTLTIANVTYADEGSITVRVSNPYLAAVTSTGVLLTVVDPPVITSPTSDSTVVKDAGQNLVLSVTQTGRVGTYQWKKGAGNLSNG